MPRYIDHELRRAAILDAAMDILAADGIERLSFRRIAERVGGASTTVVTHYYPTQRALLDDLNARLTARWTVEIAEIKATADTPRERLRRLMLWFLPDSETAVTSERARIRLLAHSGDDHLRADFRRWDAMMREYLREELRALVPADRVAELTDLLRVVTGGVALAVLEYPGEWPAERQRAVVDSLVRLLDTVTGA